MNYVKKYWVAILFATLCIAWAGSSLQAGMDGVFAQRAPLYRQYVDNTVRAALNRFDRIRMRAGAERNRFFQSIYDNAPQIHDVRAFLRPGQVLCEQTAQYARQAYNSLCERAGVMKQELLSVRNRLRDMQALQVRTCAAERKAAASEQQVAELQKLVQELVHAQAQEHPASSCDACPGLRQQLEEMQRKLHHAGETGNRMRQEHLALQRSYDDAKARITQKNDAFSCQASEAQRYKDALEQQQCSAQHAWEQSQASVRKEQQLKEAASSALKEVTERYEMQLRAMQERTHTLKELFQKQRQENEHLQKVLQDLQNDQGVVQPVQDMRIDQLQEQLKDKDHQVERLRIRVQELESAAFHHVTVPVAPPLPAATASSNTRSSVLPAAPAPRPTLPIAPTHGVSTSLSSGPSLRSVAALRAMPVAQDGRDALLAAIRQGAALRPTEQSEQRQRSAEDGSICAALAQRFKNALPDNDSSDDDEDADNEWGE